MVTTHRDDWIDPADVDRKGSRIFSHLLLLSVAVFVAAFIIWADGATLDEVTRGDGRVVPSSQVQVIQNLEGGILAAILVTEGQIVERDEVLLRIDNTAAQANYRDLRQRYLSGLARVVRLQAEVTGTKVDDLRFPEELHTAAPELVRAATDLYVVRQDQLRSQTEILRDQAVQRQQELQELDNRLRRLKQSFALAEEELRITRPLAAEGVVAQVDLLRMEREVIDLQGEIEATSLAKPRVAAALSEAKQRIEERLATFRSEASQELNERRAELASITEALAADTDRVTRTEVRSPVRGTVKEIKIRTVGGVIQPGQDLIEIVPIDDTLLVEAQIRPADIAFIRPDQSAVVKITAYDYSIYGGLDAVVEHISADTIEDKEKRENFFRIYLRTDRNVLGTADNPLPIIPGMTASVDILTGEKTVLDYLLKPILKARDSALRER